MSERVERRREGEETRKKGYMNKLFKLMFSIPLLFHSKPNKEGGNKIFFYPLPFSSSHYFLSFYFFILPIKRTLREEGILDFGGILVIFKFRGVFW